MSLFFSKESISYPFVSIIIAILNAVFWFVAARLTIDSELGIASAILSVSVLASSVAMLGIEIPLLKNSSKNKSYFGTSFLFEIMIHLALIPIVFLSLNQEGFRDLGIIFGIVILIQTGIIAVPRFALLGTISVKIVTLSNLVGAIARISTLIVFLMLGFNSTGILLATIIQGFVIAPILFVGSYKKFNFKINKTIFKIVIKEGISNFPTKISSILQNFGIITLLVFLSTANEIIAGITIAFSLFRFVSIIATSLANIALPSSTMENTDHSNTSMKIGIILSVPIIVTMISFPEQILEFYDKNYVQFADILKILGISLVPFILTTNVKIMLNNKQRFKLISILGIIESLIIFCGVLIMVPNIGEIGVAFAVLIAFAVTGIISFVLATKKTKKIFLLSMISIGISSSMILLIQSNIENVIITILIGIITSILLIFGTKLTSITEIKTIVNEIKKSKN